MTRRSTCRQGPFRLRGEVSLRLVGAVLCVPLGAACATAVPPRAAAPALAAPIEPGATSASEAEMRWSAVRPLTWSDFKAAAPSGGVESARTVYLLSYESRCRGTAFQFLVAAVFLPELSWVKLQVLVDRDESARILGHEQTHFNLTEVYARRMRKYFAELYDPCGQTEEQLRASVDRFVQDEAAAQQRYDNETGYGLAEDRQRIWDRDVGQMLGSLAQFARQ